MKVAFIGKMGSGKTTAAQHLVNTRGFVRVASGDPVKVVTAQMINQLQAYLQIYGVAEYKPYKPWTLADVDGHKHDPTIRKMLQFVGTELGREYFGHKDIWIDMLMRDVQYLDDVVVDDVRFENEADALRGAGFKIIRIDDFKDRYGTVDTHSSETELDNYDADMTIYNIYSKERFFVDVNLALKLLSQENTRP